MRLRELAEGKHADWLKRVLTSRRYTTPRQREVALNIADASTVRWRPGTGPNAQGFASIATHEARLARRASRELWNDYDRTGEVCIRQRHAPRVLPEYSPPLNPATDPASSSLRKTGAIRDEDYQDE